MIYNRIKVVDGDLIVISCGSDGSTRDDLATKIVDWGKTKSISVRCLVRYAETDSINVFSVNDVFEEIILKGENND
jgi:hypothetical protein